MEEVFWNDIKIIEQVLNKNMPAFRDKSEIPHPDKTEILKFLIFKEFSELLIVLRMIGQIFLKLKSVDLSKAINTNDYFFSTSQLTLLIKVVYEWLNHLKELMDSKVKVKTTLSKKNYEKLKGFCEFRHKLITHKTGLRIYSMGSLKYNPKKYEAEIVMTSFSHLDTADEELEKLFERCARRSEGKIDPNEKNFHERCAMLSRNLDSLSGEDRKDALSFIKRYGAASTDISDLVGFIKDLVEELLPKLAVLS